ncbi:MAG: DinB family protein [Armatimonadetes bacterium]|nr:DinB family protein [Armatimonadota bacterium]
MKAYYYLFAGLERSIPTFERIVASVPAEKLNTQTDPDRFTLHEAICHIADWETIMRGRLEDMVRTSGATLVGMDEGQRAIDQNYGSWNLKDAFAKWKEERAKTVAFLKGLTEEQWDHKGVHTEIGPVTVRQYATAMLGHDMYHLEHVSQYL